MEKLVYSKSFEKILDNIDYSKLGNNIAIKLHFGERGCCTYMDPKITKALYDKLVSLGKKAVLVECNVLYKGSRTIKKDHLEVAKEHGFDFAPIDILDGDIGQDYIEVDLTDKKLSIKSAKIGKGIKKYDSIIALTHFKGHMMGGFGGSIKNIGMGLGSRSGKMHMHATINPIIVESKCIGCGDCVENCSVDAIKLIDGVAHIDPKLCIHCAQCIETCNEGAATVPWSSIESREFQQRMVSYSHGVLKAMDAYDKIICINVMHNITDECDCWGKCLKPIMPDVGILAGNDLVAVDQAARDMVSNNIETKSGDIFKDLHNVDSDILLEYGERTKLGSRQYELIDLDK